MRGGGHCWVCVRSRCEGVGGTAGSVRGGEVRGWGHCWVCVRSRGEGVGGTAGSV